MKLLAELEKLYSSTRLFTRKSQLVAYESDGLTAFRAEPLAVVVPESQEEVIKTVHEADIEVMANYIFGLPGDTHESMRETFDLSKRLCTAGWNTYAAMALPGSQLYKKAKKLLNEIIINSKNIKLISNSKNKLKKIIDE